MGRILGSHDVQHGGSGTRLYRLWTSMRSRCGYHKVHNPSAQKYYVDRGITVCEEWRTFPPFKAWAISNGYRDDLSLDRIDSDGNYEPTNCQWLSMVANVRKRRGLKLTMEVARQIRQRRSAGERVVSLAQEFGVNASVVYRIEHGTRWAEEGA